MEFLHAGITASSEEKADRFYREILGLEKSGPKILDENLARSIFGIDKSIELIRYKGEKIDLEILIDPGFKTPNSGISHSCIRVHDINELVSKCKKSELKIVQTRKDKSTITFISDFDGNLFELKE